MLQEISTNGKESAKLDFLMVAVFLLMMIFMRRMSDFAASLPAPFNSIASGALLAALVALCYFVFSRRIVSYRYSIIYKQIADGETNIFGTEQPYPWPEGTVLFERMIANRGKINEEIRPEELVALIDPDGDFILPDGRNVKPGFLATVKQSGRSQKTASTLIYERKGKYQGIRFHPTDEMALRIREAASKNAPGRE